MPVRISASLFLAIQSATCCSIILCRLLRVLVDLAVNTEAQSANMAKATKTSMSVNPPYWARLLLYNDKLYLLKTSAADHQLMIMVSN